MRGGVPAFEAIVELGIGADAFVADQQSGAYVWMFVDEALDGRHHRVARVGDAENKLITWIIKFKT